MPSATDYKALLAEAVEKALKGNRSLERILGEEIWSVEIQKVENLVIQVRVDWDRQRPARYYNVKVSEPW